MDFAHWWSFIGKGLRLQPAQQASFYIPLSCASSWHDARNAAARHDGDAHAARHARHDAWHAAAGHDGNAHAARHAR